MKEEKFETEGWKEIGNPDSMFRRGCLLDPIDLSLGDRREEIYPARGYPARPDDARLRMESSPSRRFGTAGPVPWTTPPNVSTR